MKPHHKVETRVRLLTAFLIALIVILVDQGTKAMTLAYVSTHTSHYIWPFFNIVLVWNYGISFGVGNDAAQDQMLLIILALAIIAALLSWVYQSAHQIAPIRYIAGLIIGGATGNIIDRIRYGAVIDFLDFHLYHHHWPAFNIADSAIVIGALLWITWPSSKQPSLPSRKQP